MKSFVGQGLAQFFQLTNCCNLKSQVNVFCWPYILGSRIIYIKANHSTSYENNLAI